MVRIAARSGFHVRVPAPFPFRYHAITLATHVQGGRAAVEQNAAAFVERRLPVGVAVFISRDKARILVSHLQRIGRLAIVGEPQLATQARNRARHRLVEGHLHDVQPVHAQSVIMPRHSPRTSGKTKLSGSTPNRLRLKGRMGAGPSHMFQSRPGGGSLSGGLPMPHAPALAVGSSSLGW